MIEETMSTMTIIFVLVILLFGFDSTGQVKTRRNTITANSSTDADVVPLVVAICRSFKIGRLYYKIRRMGDRQFPTIVDILS